MEGEDDNECNNGGEENYTLIVYVFSDSKFIFEDFDFSGLAFN